jgi:1L-myo-inositol 1-phosphate cytidylyltransferase
VRGLIIAAGAGSRLRPLGTPKPLVELAGRPIIEHVARASALAGLDGLVVVVGYQAGLLEPALHDIAGRCRLPITTIRNQVWQLGNGTSVLAAEPLMKEPFALMMADHLFDPSLLASLIEAGRRSRGVDILLAIDRKLDNPLVDLDDVTRVQCIGDRIVRLGKGLSLYNAYDCGLFWCTPALFRSLAQAIDRGDCSLSAGVQNAADRVARAYGFDIGTRLWIDVDDNAAWARAEAALAAGTLLPGAL